MSTNLGEAQCFNHLAKNRQVKGFNGAMLLWAWMQEPRPKTVRFDGPLQWGHAFVGMDAQKFGILVSKGNVLLQWGHAFVGMDAPHARGERCQSYQLQWGHAFVGMDAAQSLAPAFPAMMDLASMGPCFCGHGCIKPPGVGDRSQAATMGPCFCGHGCWRIDNGKTVPKH